MGHRRFEIIGLVNIWLSAYSVLGVWGDEPFRFTLKNIVVADFNGVASIYGVDVDGDGDQDILGAARDGDAIAWWENRDRVGTVWAEHPIAADFNGAISVYGADVDGDGDQDVLGAAFNGDAIAWWENRDGSGGAWTHHRIAADFNGAVSVYGADVDGDGDQDVLGAAFNGHTIAWWENSVGDGTVWTEAPIAADFDGARSVYGADVDGDGDLDVLGAGRNNPGSITWWENSANDGTVWAEHRFTDFSGGSSVYAADMDGDGNLDIMGAAIANDIVAWWKWKPVREWPSHTVAVEFNGASSVHGVDLDGDGDQDVLGAAAEDNVIAWWENRVGDGTVWTVETIAAGFNGARSVYGADMDGDGDLDVLGAAADNGIIAWWENRVGDGSVWTQHNVAVAFDGVRSVYGADLDGDGDLDVMGAAFNGDAIAWWENRVGDGAIWDEHPIVTDFDGATSVHGADVDGDGDQDVLGAQLGGPGSIAWWENSVGDGTVWTEHSIATDFAGATSVYGADVDGDGDQDVLGAALSDPITWWENSAGAGRDWARHAVSGCCSGSHSVYAADVDSDGHLDVLGGLGGPDDGIGWWRNRARDTDVWTYVETIRSNFLGPRSISAADLDGDGDQDVLGAAEGGDLIAWSENPSTASNIILSTAATNLKANGQDATRLTAVVQTALGVTAVNDDSTEVSFRVSEGAALIDGVSVQTVRVKEGVATVVLQSSTIPGFTTVEANAGDLVSAQVAIVVRALIADIALSASNLNFGSSSTRSLTIFNRGEGTLSVSQVLSTNDALFAVSAAEFNVASGDSLTVMITFTAPATQTTITGALVIVSNDPDQQALVVRLSAGSLQPDLQVAPADSLLFSPTTVDDPAAVQQKTLIVSNAGDEVLAVNSVQSTDAQFEIAPNSFNLAPDSSQAVAVTFGPNTSGVIEASLVISSNDPNKSFIEIPLRGRGVKPQIEITPSLADFGTVEVGESASLALTISNSGEADLSVVVGLLSAPFALMDLAAGRSISLAPGMDLVVPVGFTPTTRDEVAAQLTISSNDPERATLVVPLRGRGLAPRLTVLPLELRFGQVGALDPTPLLLEITNKGDADLLVTNILASSAAFNPTPISFTLAPEEQQEVQVTFTPAVIEARSSELAETLTIFSAVDTFEVGLSAKIIDRRIQVYNYPNPIELGQSTTFWFRQNGAAEIKIFNTAGALVCALRGNGADHTILWDCRAQDGSGVPPGLYPYVYLLDGGIKQRRFLQIVE